MVHCIRKSFIYIYTQVILELVIISKIIYEIKKKNN